jgi:hypothetical protein
MARPDDGDEFHHEVQATQLPDGRWTARTRRHPNLVGVGQSAEAAVRDLADAIRESKEDD